ncbi:D-alanyl-D-alanine carboxypeptidase/D-alanyl-D-alanine-endopeptidase [Spirulina subsalsa]|uniref:D-alanyl-D-alanine carboxypeptidase/D-alanyl-D-alanine endopeptidase n=1 Tax=Spirulina subsalsa TaxID=54311 RepID=UPI0002DC1BA4|nr:D-alanyl-D-alanine carboxypeptidase/D-alanyl-D-alanine-endopeptidase [Spirulina subsalsa]
MKWILSAIATLSILAPLPTVAAPLCRAELPAAIRSILNRPEWERSRWGLLIQALNENTPLYNHHGTAYFNPASSAKLLTTAAALHHFGPDYPILTPIQITGRPPRLQTLRLVGKGDPTLTPQDLQTFAQYLRERGVTEIDHLIVEDGYLPAPATHPTWEFSDLYFYYGTVVNSLILNENSFPLTITPQQPGQPVAITSEDALALAQWEIDNQARSAPPETPYSLQMTGRVGEPVLAFRGRFPVDAAPRQWRMALRDPGAYFLAQFEQRLQAEGITVQRAEIDRTPQRHKGKETFLLQSPPLSQLIQETNQASNNLYAEVLLHTLGLGVGQESSLAALTTTLSQLGVEADTHQLRDGSGLSRHNLLSPLGLVQTLQGMETTPHREVFRASLPVAGVSGTLQGRFQDTPLAGVLLAKTGTMTGVSTLAGYLDQPDGSTVVFSIMVNQSEQGISRQRAAIDEIVLLLWDLQDC